MVGQQPHSAIISILSQSPKTYFYNALPLVERMAIGQQGMARKKSEGDMGDGVTSPKKNLDIRKHRCFAAVVF